MVCSTITKCNANDALTPMLLKVDVLRYDNHVVKHCLDDTTMISYCSTISSSSGLNMLLMLLRKTQLEREFVLFSGHLINSNFFPLFLCLMQ